MTALWIAFWLFAAISIFLDTPKQITSHKKYIETEIKPSVDFVKKFKVNNGRLPNNREYYSWESEYYKDYSSDLTQKFDSLIPDMSTKFYIRKTSDALANDYEKFKNADWEKDFAIGVWNGEWTQYYFSWTDEYVESNFTWTDGLIGLIGMIGFGLAPLMFWWFFIWRKKNQFIKP